MTRVSFTLAEIAAMTPEEKAEAERAGDCTTGLWCATGPIPDAWFDGEVAVKSEPYAAYPPGTEERDEARIDAPRPSPAVTLKASPASRNKPTLTILGGRVASGKSFFTRPGGEADCTHTIKLDCNEIKAQLPGYEASSAALYHEEASDIFNRLDVQAREAGLNVILETTMRTEGPTISRIKAYKAAGYRIEGHYMFLPPQMAASRAVDRFTNEGGRFVPPAVILASRANEANFDAAKPSFDRWTIYSNMGSKPDLYARGGK